MFSNKYKNIIGNIEFYLNSNSIVTINVRDHLGQVAKTLVKESALASGTHTFSLNLSVDTWPKGEYTVYVYEDYYRMVSKKTFELE